jgi:hypothetical protein
MPIIQKKPPVVSKKPSAKKPPVKSTQGFQFDPKKQKWYDQHLKNQTTDEQIDSMAQICMLAERAAGKAEASVKSLGHQLLSHGIKPRY